MQISFEEKDPNKVIETIKSVMGGRQLSKMVTFEYTSDQLLVKISKLGTSTLTFDHVKSDQGTQFALSGEKIALSHKPMKGEVKAKIFKVIEKAGGIISE